MAMNTTSDPQDAYDRQVSQLKSIYPSPKANPNAYRPKQAHNRISAENLSMLAKANGRCGDINPITGFVCVTQPHEDTGPNATEHMAVQIGGPNDGKVYSTWGSRKPQLGQWEVKNG